MSGAIVVTHATKVIHGRVVLDDVTLTLPRGGIYGFSGINGSGKTMLFRAISGLIHLTSGQVDVFGQRIGVDVDFPRSLGLVLESAGFWDESTGLRNLTMLASIRGVAGEAEARAALARVGLAPDDDRPFSAYSMGMRQRLTIAQAIMEAPELLILDEPTNALDVDGIETVAKIVREERERGCTVLVACHNEPALEALFERSWRMVDGHEAKEAPAARADRQDPPARVWRARGRLRGSGPCHAGKPHGLCARRGCRGAASLRGELACIDGRA